MLRRLVTRGFKSLRDVDVALGPLTVFVGGNGTGKTSTLEAARFLVEAMQPRARTIAVRLPLYNPGLDRLRTRGHDGPVEISLELGLSAVDCTVEGSFEDLGYVVSVRAEGLSTRSRVSVTPRTDIVEPGYVDLTIEGDVPTMAREAAAGVRMYGLDARAMARPTYSSDEMPRIGHDGRNLATVLSALAGSDRDRFDAIEAELRAFLPNLRRLKIKRVPITVGDAKVAADQVSFDFDNATDVAADEASEGTMLLLGLLTIVESSETPDVTIMLDDLDRALHPDAQRVLVGYLRRLIDKRAGLQVIATTHSPYLVEHLDFDQVLATTLDPTRGSVIQPLIKHPDAARWRDEMSAGEFWSSVGESWVAYGTGAR